MAMEVYDHRKSVWSVAAERHLRQALADLADGIDAIPATDSALRCLWIEAGERPPDEDLLDPEDSAALLSNRTREG